MATLSALYVAIEDAERVSEALRAFAAPGAGAVDSGRLENDAAFYEGDHFFQGLATRPSAFAVGVQQRGWVTAHAGAFEGVGELASSLSKDLDVRVVVAQGQTTAEAWRVSVHEKGRSLRHLEFADGEWTVQQGSPFAFESQPLGTNIAEPGEEPCYDFGFDEAAAYCRELGLQFWSDQQPEDGWVWIRVASGSGGEGETERAGGVGNDASRSWWRRLFGA